MSASITKLANSSAIILVGTVAGQLIGFVYALVAARWAGGLVYGQLALLLAGFSVVVAATTAGLNRTTVRFTALYAARGDSERLKGTQLAIGGVLLATSALTAALLFAFAPFIAQSYLQDRSLSAAVKVLACAVPVAILLSFCCDVLRGLGYAERRTYIESIVQRPLRLVLILALPAGLTLVGLAAIEAAVYGVGLIIAGIWLASRNTRDSGRPRVPVAGLVAFSLPLVPASVLNGFGYQTEAFVLGAFGHVFEAGVFNAALRLASFGSVILVALNANFAPLITSLSESRRFDELRELFRAATRWQLMAMLGWAGLTILMAPDLLGLFGAEFASFHLVVVLLCLKQVIDTIFGPVGLMVTMSGRAGLTLLNAVILVAASLLLDLAFIPSFGAVGAAVAVMGSALVLNVIVAGQVWRLHRVHAFSAELVSLVLAVSGLAGGLLFARATILASMPAWSQVLFVAAAFSAGYAGFLCKWSTASDRRVVRQMASRVWPGNFVEKAA